MPDSDIEARVRAALVSAFPPVEDVATSFAPALRPHRGRVVGSMLAAAVLVVALAVTIALTRSSNKPVKPGVTRTPTPSVTSTARVVKPVPANMQGTRWLLVKLTYRQGTIDVKNAYPSTQSAGVEGVWLHLSHNGAIGAEDSVNFLSGKFALTGDQLEVASGGTTYAAYGGHDAGRLAIIDAIDGVFSNGDAVAVTGTTSELVLTSGEYVLTFTNDGSLPDDSAPPASLVPPTPGTPNIPVTSCPSKVAIRQLTHDLSLPAPGQVANHHFLSCHYQGPGDFDSLTVLLIQGSQAYDTALQEAQGLSGSTLTHPQIGDRAFRVASKEGSHPADNFGVQRGDLVVIVGCVGPSANLASELALANDLLH